MDKDIKILNPNLLPLYNCNNDEFKNVMNVDAFRKDIQQLPFSKCNDTELSDFFNS
jgi:hypothetical protein